MSAICLSRLPIEIYYKRKNLVGVSYRKNVTRNPLAIFQDRRLGEIAGYTYYSSLPFNDEY